MEKLYHKDIGFPDFNIKKATLKVQYTRHALRAARNDRYGDITLPKTVKLTMDNIVEIGLVGQSITKVVTRQKHCNRFDLVVVLSTPSLRVRTVWLNEISDKHNSLDKSKYEVP